MNDLLSRKPTYQELVDAIEQFCEDRAPEDINTIPLFRVAIRIDPNSIKPCPECDHECDEPCNTTAEECWAALDVLEYKFRCPVFSEKLCMAPTIDCQRCDQNHKR